MKIVVLAQHFPPETAPTGRRAQDLAESLTRRGHEVTVITGQPNHPAALDRSFCRCVPPVEESPQGYLVLRVPVFRSSDDQSWKRLITYITFMLASAWRGMRQPRPDAIVAISPLPAGLAAMAVHWWYRVPLIFDLQDIWPDSARAVGVIREGFALGGLRQVERLLYRSCARVVVISEGFKRYLAGRGVPRERISVIPNGVQSGMFYGALPERRIRHARPLQDDFVVGYVGNHGLAQGLETALDAARCLEREPVRFLLIGEGVEKRRLERRARAAGLKNVQFLRGVPRTRVPGLLKACDALLVILRDDPLFRITIPSKVYEYMAAGKPVLCSVEGECADLVAEARCGLAILPDDGQALAAAIRQLASDPAAARAMGESGANWARAHCDRSSVMEAYHRVLREALHNPPRNVAGRGGLKAEVSSL